MTGGLLPRRHVRLGTRGSELARWQANHVAGLLRASWGSSLEVEIVVITTEGDRVQDRPLHELGGKGVFVRAIEEALLREEVDLAVHSMKDLPSRLPEGLVIACTPEREDARDVLVGPPGLELATLPAGTRLGTGSLRRSALALRVNPGLRLVPLRGNVPTRVRKVDDGEVDAVLLAGAGLRRLGLHERVTEWIAPERMCPSACQGILALETRTSDVATRSLLAPLSHAATSLVATVERAFLQHLGAGCNVPLGCHATLPSADVLAARAVVVGPGGRPCFSATKVGKPGEAAALGVAVADVLLRLGAGRVLDPAA
jgi:hydroxymethylbilane synthase